MKTKFNECAVHAILAAHHLILLTVIGVCGSARADFPAVKNVRESAGDQARLQANDVLSPGGAYFASVNKCTCNDYEPNPAAIAAARMAKFISERRHAERQAVRAPLASTETALRNNNCHNYEPSPAAIAAARTAKFISERRHSERQAVRAQLASTEIALRKNNCNDHEPSPAAIAAAIKATAISTERQARKQMASARRASITEPVPWSIRVASTKE